MSRGYSATPFWGLSRCRDFFVKISRLHIVRTCSTCVEQSFTKIADPMREIQRFPNLGHNLCDFTRLHLQVYTSIYIRKICSSIKLLQKVFHSIS